VRLLVVHIAPNKIGCTSSYLAARAAVAHLIATRVPEAAPAALTGGKAATHLLGLVQLA
jgi:hypothetical protein